MKKLVSLFIAFCLISTLGFTQALPFKYQAVIHDNDGKVLPNKTVGLRVSILQDTNAVVVYREEFTKTSDEFGIIDLEIGTGTVLNGNYLTIDWSKYNNQLKTEIDMNGGTTYSLLGTTSILSAPIANYALRAGGATFPAGLIMPFGGDVADIPDGWLLCDGSEVNRTDYANLFAAIKVAWGAGDLTETFNLPDLRGMFLRGVNNGRTDGFKDPDVNSRTPNGSGNKDAVGSTQGDEFKSHYHPMGATTGAHSHTVKQGTTAIKWGDSGGNSAVYIDSGGGAGSYGGSITAAATDDSKHTHTIDASGGTESRAKNAYVNYIIKY